MDFNVESIDFKRQPNGCLVLGVTESRQLTGTAQAVDEITNGAIGRVLESGDFERESEQTLLLHGLPNLPTERVLLVGFGKERERNGVRYRSAILKAFETLGRTGAVDCAVFPAEIETTDRDPLWRVRQIVETARYATYRSDSLQTKKRPPKLNKVLIDSPADVGASAVEAAVREGVAIANGVQLARELGDLPGNICTPTYLADRARALAENRRQVVARVMEEKEMKKRGMGALLAVARGSREPAKLITLEYKGGPEKAKPIVLVGKGITFDSGGISLKPGTAMDEMKFDMCGAASVLGALRAAIELSLPINVVGIIPTTENLPGGNAIKPGDIITTLSGQTVEILNTDAEGRLILCDALTHAAQFDPDVVIDIATLTGACRIALGAHAAGLLSNNEPLVAGLLKAGSESIDRLWPLPLWEEYQDQLKSNFADMANVGGRLAGAITAACFLSRFTGDYHWAHLDIAGVSALSGKKKGATGRPTALLAQYLIHRAQPE
uniref:Probable cytosol aminopeptidase n=1 Tax=Candidatus Kentrum eta TaxID=2126337 RepID=A0A450VMP6_9GAMM|nr:MAG: aminopeptidase A. Metallo peptidase. MEROPS family M17 [Candidatus Kentron sp. H]VFK03474.1 MAG: aminopeptidase A. Metallo peptidase. MEROPS family M17 [Candidatus Kentron sp. H]VFK06088.1 MAG: aminopeptidase A. Metallo peptidase. MEROPS family M17 [Candidatus Kentron sp. H]